MGGLRGRLGRLERDSSSDRLVLIDSLDGRSYHVPRGAFILMLQAAMTGEVDPEIEAIMPTDEDPHRLERLYRADDGEPFWFEPSARRRREEEAAEEK